MGPGQDRFGDSLKPQSFLPLAAASRTTPPLPTYPTYICLSPRSRPHLPPFLKPVVTGTSSAIMVPLDNRNGELASAIQKHPNGRQQICTYLPVARQLAETQARAISINRVLQDLPARFRRRNQIDRGPCPDPCPPMGYCACRGTCLWSVGLLQFSFSPLVSFLKFGNC